MSDLRRLLNKSIGKKDNVALLFSGGIDSAVVYNLLKEKSPFLYTLQMEGVQSDDFKSFNQVCRTYQLPHKVIPINQTTNLTGYKQTLIHYGIPKNKPASLLVMGLFCHLITNIDEDTIYSGLGSDAFYGLGRNFAIQCSIKGEKPPTLKSMNQFREKTYKHYMEQYVAIQRFASKHHKTIISPFMSDEVFDYFQDKTFNECNKPKKKQILIDLYPAYFSIFKPRVPSNMHCGNSEFKKIKI